MKIIATLISILLVMAWLMYMMVFVWSEPVDDPQIRTTNTIKMTKRAIDSYYSQYRMLPDSLENLITEGFSREIPMDSWGNEVQYGVLENSKAFFLFSYGADGIEGGNGVNKDIKIVGEIGI